MLTSGLRAQSLIVNPLSLDFGINTELISDSLPLQISNSGIADAHVSLRIPFQVYGSNPYSIRDSLFLLPAGQSKTLYVRCRIFHNTPNPAALIIETPWQENGGDHAVSLRCQGRYSNSYYNASENLEEEALKQSLKTITGNNYNGFSYDVARDKMYGSIDNHNDTVTCIYTGRKARFNTRSGAAANNFNCEHTFPQSLFSQNVPMRSDLHHLFSTDDAANNSRGNLPFGLAVPPLVAISTNAPSKNGGGRYEPQDLQKGATARAMMYFVIRYEDFAGFFASQENILRQWHQNFPPLPVEIARNQAIFGEQANRNPFTDYPQFADRIHLFAGNSQNPAVKKLMISDSVLYTAAGTNPSEAGLSLVVWNQGNQPVQIQNLRFLHQHYLVEGNTNPSLPANSALQIRLSWNPDSSLANAGPDTLAFSSNDPAHPFVKIPWIRQPVTGLQTIQKNQFRLIRNPEDGSFRITDGSKFLKNAVFSACDLTGRSRTVLENPAGHYRFQESNPGISFLHIQQGNVQFTLPYLIP